jgi:hypothetical protein
MKELPAANGLKQANTAEFGAFILSNLEIQG